MDPTEGERTNKQRRTLGWAWQTARDLDRTLVLPEFRLYDSSPEHVGVNAAAQVSPTLWNISDSPPLPG